MMKHQIAATLKFTLGLTCGVALLASASLAIPAAGHMGGPVSTGPSLGPLFLSGVLPGVSAVQEDKPLYYGSIKTDGVVVRNLMDAKGLPMTELQSADVVAVYGEEIAGWLEVEIPSGYAAYVFGRFLEPVENSSVYRVTRNAINIRPRAADDVRSFPLPQRLHAGDQVVVIGQDDPNKPMAEDWVRIWTPQGVRAFVRAENITALETEAGRSAWAKASAEIADVRADFLAGRVGGEASGNRGATSATSGDSEASTEAEAVEAGVQNATPAEAHADARSALRQLRRRIEVEQSKTTPDYGTLESELSDLMGSSDNAEFQAEVARELDRVGALNDAAAMMLELQRMKDQQDQETARIQNSIWEHGQNQDPLHNAYDVRGILVRKISADGTPRYTVEVRREVIAEVLCTTGRYNLDVFSGYEIGLRGRSIVAEAAATRGQAALDAPILDVARISVLKRR